MLTLASSNLHNTSYLSGRQEIHPLEEYSRVTKAQEKIKAAENLAKYFADAYSGRDISVEKIQKRILELCNYSQRPIKLEDVTNMATPWSNLFAFKDQFNKCDRPCCMNLGRLAANAMLRSI